MRESNYAVSLYPSAERDLESIFDYVFDASKERGVATKLLDEIENEITKLSFMPNSCPKVNEERLAKKGFRKLLFGEYVIPFLVDEAEKTVYVVRVFHGKMNYQRYL